MLYYTALVTLASVLFYAYLGVRVALARGQYNVAAPATAGHPIFERIYRVHMNTLEWMVIYLPCLWLFGSYVSDPGAGLLGLHAGQTQDAAATVLAHSIDASPLWPGHARNAIMFRQNFV